MAVSSFAVERLVRWVAGPESASSTPSAQTSPLPAPAWCSGREEFSRPPPHLRVRAVSSSCHAASLARRDPERMSPGSMCATGIGPLALPSRALMTSSRWPRPPRIRGPCTGRWERQSFWTVGVACPKRTAATPRLRCLARLGPARCEMLSTPGGRRPGGRCFGQPDWAAFARPRRNSVGRTWRKFRFPYPLVDPSWLDSNRLAAETTPRPMTGPRIRTFPAPPCGNRRRWALACSCAALGSAHRQRPLVVPDNWCYRAPDRGDVSTGPEPSR